MGYWPHSARKSWLEGKEARKTVSTGPRAPRIHRSAQDIARRRLAQQVWRDIKERADFLLGCPTTHNIERLQEVYQLIAGEPWVSPLDRLRCEDPVPPVVADNAPFAIMPVDPNDIPF